MFVDLGDYGKLLVICFESYGKTISNWLTRKAFLRQLLHGWCVSVYIARIFPSWRLSTCSRRWISTNTQITQYFLGWNYHRIQLWKGPARKRRGKTKSDRSDQQFGRYAAVFPRTNNSCSENWIQYRIKLRSIRNSSKTQSWKTAFGLYRSSQDRTSQVPWYSIFHHRRRSASRYVTGTGCWTRLYYFHRGTTDIPNVLRSLDCFVLSSEVESLPLSIREAMSMSLPVIATD